MITETTHTRAKQVCTETARATGIKPIRTTPIEQNPLSNRLYPLSIGNLWLQYRITESINRIRMVGVLLHPGDIPGFARQLGSSSLRGVSSIRNPVTGIKLTANR